MELHGHWRLHSLGRKTINELVLFHNESIQGSSGTSASEASGKYNIPIICLSRTLILPQIIKEKLAFPSGTATAQLISVLHRKPLPGTALRNRRAYSHLGPVDTSRGDYQAIPSADLVDSQFQHSEGLVDEADIDDDQEREEVHLEGWSMLGWSFAASAGLTVSRLLFPRVCLTV